MLAMKSHAMTHSKDFRLSFAILRQRPSQASVRLTARHLGRHLKALGLFGPPDDLAGPCSHLPERAV
ncbi:MAG: hypothetical protein VR74_01435 [Hyphomonas sp. BRH_c22]|nr:MAG: hypothetical protein VR74_01435 [Hyphomonas sp. BRH_c22]